MLPKKEFNVFPRSHENVTAILKKYFPLYEQEYEKAMDDLENLPSLSLNQIEFMVRKLSEALEIVFKPYLINPSLSNLVSYGIEALTPKGNLKGASKARIQITKDFKDFVMKTENKFDFIN